MKAAPPFEAVWKGNDQMFPEPDSAPDGRENKTDSARPGLLFGHM